MIPPSTANLEMCGMQEEGPETATESEREPVHRRVRPTASHLKAVPETLTLRDELRAKASEFVASLTDHRSPLKVILEQHARALLVTAGHPEKYLGFMMVMLGNAFWKRRFLAVPFDRRMLLLPHRLEHTAGCAAERDQFGASVEQCRACSVSDYKVRAEQLGYKVLVAEGSSAVLKIIVEGNVDAILGVASLDVLEKAIDQVLIAGIPSYAVPLHSADCKDSSLDETWIWEILEKYEPQSDVMTQSYLDLMRASNRLFDKDFERLLPRVRSKTPEHAKSPLGITEHVAYDWLQNGGKRFRPFITLAAYDAVAGTRSETGTKPELSDDVARVAMAIEAFHKASLVHDDIQDDDLFRYGRQTLHRTQGMGPAINIGDYLIGLGYRLVNSCRGTFGADAAADITENMASAHIKLCDGQGSEMAWKDSPDWKISPLDALQIYALKTSPAFEAALFAGLRMAGSIEPYAEMIPQFCRHLGVGFQILNDLADWRGDENNKMLAGQDALALRPTVLLSLALQAATDGQKRELREIMQNADEEAYRLNRLRRLFSTTGAFNKAEGLVEKSRERAEELADKVEPPALRQLLYFLVETVLAEEEVTPQEATNAPLMPSPALVGAT